MTNKRIMIVEARFYPDIADELVKGAMAEFEKDDVKIDRISVPGVFEIPTVIGMAHKYRTGMYDGFLTLGCVIRGETSHYDYVCGESARGLMEMGTHFGLAIGYGILTVENREQAWARARVEEGNKGATAAIACLRMIELKRQFASHGVN